MVDRRAKPLLPFAVLGCFAAILAASGGAGTLLGAILALVLLITFSSLYLAGRIGPQLPPFRIPRRVLSVAMWVMVALTIVLAILLVNGYSGRLGTP